MILHSGIFLAGLVILYFGTEGLVKGSTSLAKSLGVRALVIGLTIIAFGTNLPEIFVSITATIQRRPSFALGNAIGSCIANIGLVLGISCLISSTKVERMTIKREIPILIFASLLVYFLASDSHIGRGDGLILILFFLLFLSLMFYRARKDSNPLTQEREKKWKRILLIIFGFLGLIIGARMMVKGAVFIAQYFGVSEVVIGLTIVAIGTSLPELGVGVVGAFRKKQEIALGTVIGSNIFNLLLLIGIISLINPIPVERGTLRFELPIMIVFSLILLPFMKSGFRLSKIEGLFLLIGYIVFVIFAWT